VTPVPDGMHLNVSIGSILAQKSKIGQPKNLAKVDLGTSLRCLACKRYYEGPWSILAKAIWSLTSPRVRRISGSKNFRSSPQKDFFNNIGQKLTWLSLNGMSHPASRADIVR
jgi:hypothetical protein